MEIVIILLGLLLLGLGVIGAVAPVLPGPVISFLGLLVIHFFLENAAFSSSFLWWMGGLSVFVVLLDNFVPILGAQQFGSTRQGLIGGTIGLVIGLLFMGPFGIVIGPFAGTVIAELMQKRTRQEALRSGVGSLVGFIVGVLIKLTYSIVATVYFVKQTGSALDFF